MFFSDHPTFFVVWPSLTSPRLWSGQGQVSSQKRRDKCSRFLGSSYCGVNVLLVLFSELSRLLHKVHQGGEHGDVTRLKTHLLDLRQTTEQSNVNNNVSDEMEVSNTTRWQIIA